MELSRLRTAFCAAIAGVLSLTPLHAQFYTGGGDPGRLNWSTAKDGRYQMIYPKGLDSLASVYSGWLDTYQDAAGVSTGMTWRAHTIPVVLHGYSTTSNGLVTWAPRRLELYAQPSVYDPEPLYWPKSLAVHETRHLHQMQAGYRGVFRWMRIFLGELVPGGVSGLYPGQALLEGDAVVAETGLTEAGRGRNADFLEYYHWAFDNGDFRDWYRWRYGSWKFYAPNHYALGYLTIAGDRVFYDDPLFMSRYLTGISRHPLRIMNMQKEVKSASGKLFSAAFRAIQDSTATLWRKFDAARGPFMEALQISPDSKWHEDYSSLCLTPDGGLYAIRAGKADSPELVKFCEDGVERTCSVASTTSRLSYGGGRLWWSETVAGRRWSLGQTSRIRYMDEGAKRPHYLTRKGRLYNPKASPDGTKIAAIDYPYGGGSAVVVLSADDGRGLQRYAAPDSMDLYEPAWAFGGLVAAATSLGGNGIYSVPDFRAMAGPLPVTISNLQGNAGELTFASDRNGVNEVYDMREDGSVLQITNTRYGTKEAIPGADSSALFYLMESGWGHKVYSSGKFEPKEVDFNDIRHHYLADGLSRQEQALSAIPQHTEPQPLVSKHFFKATPRFHSWIPFYTDLSGISDDSFDEITSTAKIGATAFFQNPLGDLYGSVAYGYGPDPDASDGDFRHSGHLSLTYTGLFPAFSFEAYLGDRQSLQYQRFVIGDETLSINQMTYQYLDRPSFRGVLRMYVPLNFSSGGVYRGLTPSIKYHFSNDQYDKAAVIFANVPSIGGNSFAPFYGFQSGRNMFMQQLDVTLRGYSMRATPEAAEYPRLGIGAELGYHARVGLTDFFTAGAYSYLYGYLPGFTKVQGLRLTALYQHKFADGVLYGENTVTTVPRGFVTTGIKRFLASNSSDQLRMTADYAIPIWVGDISFMSPLFYVKNFVLKPHADIAMLSFGDSLTDGNLVSLGADFSAKLANFLWLPYDTAIGVTLDWKGGKSWDLLRSKGVSLGDRLYVAMTFTMDL